jgi:hypothetical protein
MKIPNMNKRLPVFLACALVALCRGLSAQEPATTNSNGLDFQNHGEITVGYRFTDVSGYKPQFQQMFNLRDGFRLQDFLVRGSAKDNENHFADGYSISASGLGGDPFATAQLKVGKTGRYDLRVQWRQSYYYWNQNDNVVLPITSVAPTLSTGLTDNHDWATVRKLGSADLTIYATKNLRFNLDVARTTTNGNLLTTRSLEFFNAPSYWGGFARANPYPLNAPLDDETNRFTGGVDYSWRDWHFHYKAGFQSFNESIAMNPLAPGDVSVNPATLSQSEPLIQLSWTQTRRLNTPVSEFSFQGKLRPDLEWRGGYSYSRYRGPVTQDFSFSGIAPNSAGVLTPYSVSEGGRSQVTEPGNIVNQGFTWYAKPWLAINADYRYTRYTSETTSDVQSTFNGTISSGGDEIEWKSGLSDLEVSVLLTPVESLVLRPGIRLSKVDIKSSENGVVDGARTLRTKHARPELQFGYTPVSKLSFRGDIHSATSGSSYTAITPHTTVAGKLIARYDLLPNLSVENALRISTARLVDSGYRNSIRANTIMVSYALNERFSAFGGLSYDSFFAQGEIVYARPVSLPLRSEIRDQEIHRVWQAGFDLKPVRFMGVRFSGNYDRLTGVGEILGEPPAYGPLKWPLATGTLYMDIPKAGRLWVDLQRTYYVEELVPANNFSANLLMLRFTRTF